MSRLTIEKQTGGTPFELQTRNGTTTDRWLDVIVGGIHSVPDARVVNTEIPGATGLVPEGDPVDDSLVVKIAGEIAGVGATALLRRASFRSQMVAFRAQTPSAGTMVIVKAYAPNEGMAGAEVATLVAQLQRFVWEPVMGWERQSLTMELLCLSDPVGWSIA